MACFNCPLRSMVMAAATLALLVVSVSLVAHARNTADYTEAEQTNTLKFLQMFSSWSPLMASNWTGTDFCSWVYIECDDNGDLAFISGFGPEVLPDGYMFSLPEMSDEIVAEDVALTRFGAIYMPNHLMGTLPNTWGRLTRLTDFHVISFNVTGTLPDSYGAWNKVRNLRFYSDELTGSIPASWGQMTSLQYIMITSSQLCGCIPEEWRLMSLTGSLPSSVETENCSTANVCPLETTTTTTEEPATSSSSASSTSAATTTTEEPMTTTTEKPVTSSSSFSMTSAATSSSSSSASSISATTTTTEEPMTTTTEKPVTSSSSFSMTSAATSSSSSSASSISATTTSTTAVCAVAHCLQCHKESASVCVLCATGYTPTVDLRCALPISGARFPTVASTGLWTALVVLVFLVAFVSPA